MLKLLCSLDTIAAMLDDGSSLGESVSVGLDAGLQYCNAGLRWD